MPMPPRFLLLPALALLAACASHESRVGTTPATAATSSPPTLTGALGAPIAPPPDDAAGFSGGTSAPAPIAMPGAPMRMSANEIQAALANNSAQGVTTEGQPYTLYFTGDGQERFRQGDYRDSGTWRVLPDGRFCSALTRVSNNNQQCYIMYRNGQNITFERPDGVTVGSVTVTPGNPQSL